jgi:hypothetical protein
VAQHLLTLPNGPQELVVIGYSYGACIAANLMEHVPQVGRQCSIPYVLGWTALCQTGLMPCSVLDPAAASEPVHRAYTSGRQYGVCHSQVHVSSLKTAWSVHQHNTAQSPPTQAHLVEVAAWLEQRRGVAPAYHVQHSTSAGDSAADDTVMMQRFNSTARE